MQSSTGGRVTVMQTMLPTVGQGALENREASSQASSLVSSGSSCIIPFEVRIQVPG